jgi:fatty-acyl-CoA synthase
MRIWEIREKLPKVKLWIQVDDGTESLLHGAIDFERAIRSATPAARINRPGDDVYMLYTGGTTGMPKGVMYPNGGFCRGLATGGLGMHGLAAPETPDGLPELVRQIKQMGALPVSLAACPQMHGTGLWLGTLLPMLCGGAVVTIPTRCSHRSRHMGSPTSPSSATRSRSRCSARSMPRRQAASRTI